MIDLDLHAGDRDVFIDQLRVLLGRFWGHSGWHLETKTEGIGGVHLIRAFSEHRRTTHEVSKLKNRLTELDLLNPDLSQRAVEAGMPPLSRLEVYPQEDENGVRLPLGRERTMLLDRPLGTVTDRGKSLPDLHAYLRWIHDSNRKYMPAEDVIDYVQARLAVVVPKAKPETIESVKGNSPIVHSVKIFDPLKGRFRHVLVEFFTGKLAPQCSLNAGIVMGARVLFHEQVDADSAAIILGQYVRDLPNTRVSGRLERGEFEEIDRVIRSTVQRVYNENGGQSDSEKSSALLTRTAESWEKVGFRFCDKSTWATAKFVTKTPQSITLSDEVRHQIAEPMAFALKVSDLKLAVEVAEYLVGIVTTRQESGSGLAVAYFKKVIEQEFGIKCGANGKVNNVLKVMCGLGLIRKVMPHQYSVWKGKGVASKYETGWLAKSVTT